MTTAPTLPSALSHYGKALRRIADGRNAELRLVDPTGRRAPIRLSATDWCGDSRAGDEALLARCRGSTLDIGCGPGRLTAALSRRSIPALGIDISGEAIRQARRRGARVRLACVLTGDVGRRWHHVLLADGNVGIGGDPARLIARCAQLLQPGGDLLVELDPPGTVSWSGYVSLDVDGALSAPFAWAGVTVDDINSVAATAGVGVQGIWTEARRWFASIAG